MARAASLVMGNARGDVWTDLVVAVAGPPVSVVNRGAMIEYSRPQRGALLTRAAPVSGTPWVSVVEEPRANVLAPARVFLGRAMLGALVLILAGGTATWQVSRRIARPLRTPSESAARQSEPRYRQLVDSIADYAILMLDRTGRVAPWNPGAERAKGYHADEIIGRDFSVFYTPEDVARRWPPHPLQRAAAEGRGADGGCRVRKDA